MANLVAKKDSVKLELVFWRGVNCAKEQESILNQVYKLKLGRKINGKKILGSWFSTDLSDAINFAQRTKGIVIKCRATLYFADEDEFLTTIQYKKFENHKGWGVRETDPRFSDGTWYYVNSSYTHNVEVLEVLTYQESVELEKVFYQ